MRGRKAMAAWLKEQRRSHDWLAREISRRMRVQVSQQTVSRWMRGATKISLVGALGVEAIAGIPPKEWLR